MLSERPDWRDALLDAQPSAFVVADEASGVLLRVSDAFADHVRCTVDPVAGASVDAVLGETGLLDRLRSTRPGRVGLLSTGREGDAETEAAVHEVEHEGIAALLLVVDLAERTHRLQRVLDELAEFPKRNPGPVLRLSGLGRVELANDAAGRLFGRERLVGASWHELCPAVTEEVWTRVLAADRPVSVETGVGERRMSFTHVSQPVREVVFVFGSDVTTLRRQEELIAEQARFPDMNPGPVLRLDLEGTVLLSNVATRHLIPGARTGSSWLGQVPGVDRDFWARVLASTEPVATEARIGDRDLQFTHRLDPGRNVFVYGADVTAQKAAERAARDSERLATLGTLAAGVAHELNNPAAAARRAAAHLTDALARMRRSGEAVDALNLSQDARRAVTDLERVADSRAGGRPAMPAIELADREDEVDAWLAAHGHAGAEADLSRQWVRLGLGADDLAHLASQVGDSLPAAAERVAAVADVSALVEQVARSTARVSEIALALKRYTYLGQAEVLDVDIHQGLDDTLLLLGHKLTAGPAVVRDLAGVPLSVWGIGSELNQVWMNLVDNAIDATGPRGTVVLRTRATRREGNDWVEVDVEDDGPGIPDGARARVFEPFFTTKAPGSGTGLGLATSRSIVVDRHHGSLTVDSHPGRTVFTVGLPVTHHDPREGGAS